MSRPRPRRAHPATPWQKARKPLAIGGAALIAIASISVARAITTTSDVTPVAAAAQPRTQPPARWGTRTPLPTPTLGTPTATTAPTTTSPTPSQTTPKTASRTPSKTPSRTANGPSETASRTQAQKPVAALPKAAPKPAGGNCPTLQGGGGARARALHQALCANFPQIRAYGGTRPGDWGFHGSGRAVDVMTSDYATGTAIAEWARANASTYGVTEVIWWQKIWTTQRNGEGWRGMGDRGSANENHKTHVHISVR